MTVSAELKHDIRTVYEVLTDPQYLVDRNLALGELSAECEVEAFEDGATIKALREVRRELPGILAKLFEPVNILEMTENWREGPDGWDGEWTMEVRAQPVTIYGRFELVPTAGGCRYSVSHRARVKVPLVAGQVEKFLLQQTASGAADELEYLKSYLNQK